MTSEYPGRRGASRGVPGGVPARRVRSVRGLRAVALRQEVNNTTRAEFTNVTGLETGDFVRIAGVEVGKVKDDDQADTTALVEFTADDSVVLTEGTARSSVTTTLGGRYLALRRAPAT